MKALAAALVAILVVALAGEATIAYFAFGPRPTATGAAVSSTPLASATGATAEEISVMSQGTVSAKPDVAYLTAGVESRAATAAEALSQNSASMQQVVAALKSLGLRDEDLQTQGLSIYPNASPPAVPNAKDGNQIVGYVAHNSLVATVGDLSKMGTMLDAVIQAGANSSNGISFGVKDDARLRNEALRLATTNARARADIVASSLGVRIASLRSLSEDYTSNAERPGVGGLGGAEGPPIEPGRLTITARVRATYAYAR